MGNLNATASYGIIILTKSKSIIFNISNSWLMQELLIALGYTHLSDYVAALTHINFATQLEAHGLWHWAIFVLLHLRDSSRRRAAVQDLLLRHIEIDDTVEYVQRERFLKEELGISPIWIYEAKAIKSNINKRYNA